MESRKFGVWDYIVCVATLTLSFSIGVFFAIRDRKRNTPANYFLAEGKSRILSVTLSFVITFQSSIMIIGTPVEVYLYGMRSMYEVIGILVAFIASGLIIVPVFHPLDITSSYRYFSLRFESNAVRYLALFAGVTQNTFYMGFVTFGTCLALQVMMGVPYWATILLCTTLAIVYTSIGGIKAVIWSDVFQLVIMLIGIIALLAKSIMDSGDILAILKVSSERLDMTDFRFDPRIRYQFWNTTLGAFGRYLFLTCSQSGIQRVKSVPTVKSARKIYFIAAPLYCLFYLLAAFQGVSLYSYYSLKGCDPLHSGRVKNSNELVPVAVLDLFHNMPGFAGLFIAALFSAVLSTLSSCLSCASAITYDDVILEKYPDISDKRATFVSKIVVFVYGAIGVVLTFAISQLKGTLMGAVVAFIGCMTGPSTGMYLLSIMSRRVTSKAVFVGGLCGMAMSFWLAMGQTLTGLTPSERLPPGPTDHCASEEMSVTFPVLNETWSSANNFTPILQSFTTSHMKTSVPISTTELSETNERNVSGINNLYTISFTLFPLIGLVTTILVAAVVSVFTNPPENFDERCVFSFYRHILNECNVKQKKREQNDVAEQVKLTCTKA